MRFLPWLALFNVAALAAPTGKLRLSSGFLDLDAYAVTAATASAGPWVVSLVPAALSGAASQVESALARSPACGSLLGFLPPSAVYIHVPRGAPAGECLSRLTSLEGVVERVAALPAHLRSPMLVPAGGSGAAAAPRALLHLRHGDATTPPVRRAAVHLAPGVPDAHASLSALLASHQAGGGEAGRCPSCALGGNESHAFLSSHHAGDCAGACAWDAPASCGCGIPHGTVAALAGHPDVLWVEAFSPPVARNAFARQSTMTSNMQGNARIRTEFGSCGVASGCLPSTLPLAYFASLVNASAGTGALAAPDALLPPVAPALAQAGSCASTCTTAACGQAYTTCGNYASPLTAAGLTGAGQLLAVVDDGFDVTHPFFADAAVATVNFQQNKTTPLVLDGVHRKVAAYWAFGDNATGGSSSHGTHVAGSAAGAPDTSTMNADDAALLSLSSGSAPGARVILTDISCNNPSGCPVPAGVAISYCPSGHCPMAFMIPDDLMQLYGPLYTAGARVVTNSWGGTQYVGAYTWAASKLDGILYNHPDFACTWSAGNDGNSQGLSLDPQPVAKNLISVGAALDGIDAHLAKIHTFTGPQGRAMAPLFGVNTRVSCSAIFSWHRITEIQNGIVPSGDGCPAILDAPACAQLAFNSIGFQAPYTALRSKYDSDFDFALCCGCSLASIIEGAAAVATSHAFQTLVNMVYSSYNGNAPVSFSSRGPTADGRMKPDVAAPGTEIVSARAIGYAPNTLPYGRSACPSGQTIITGSVPLANQISISLVGSGIYQSTLGSGKIASVFLTATEATTLRSIFFPIQNLTISGSAPLGRAFFYLIMASYSDAAHTTLNHNNMVSMPFAAEVGGLITNSGGSGMVNFTGLDFEMPVGDYLELRFFLSTGASVTATTTSASVSASACWGALDVVVDGMQLVTTQAGASSFLSQKSGTSMATPHVGGLATLTRQYFTDGFYPGGAAGSSPGFSPSSALIKAVLVNSATPTYVGALQAMYPDAALPAKGPTDPMNALGAGVVNLVRGLSFASLGTDTRASGVLPTLLALGLTTTPAAAPLPPPGAALAGVDARLNATGDSRTFCVDIPAGAAAHSPAPWLSLALVWTDPPALPLAYTALVNNLDLAVYPPNATSPIYGNTFNTSASPSIPDTANNVERLYLANAAPTLDASGSRIAPPYRISILAPRIIYGPQAFALVATGPRIALAASSLCAATPATPVVAAGTTNNNNALVAATAVLGSLLFIGIVVAGVVCYVFYRRSQPGAGAATKIETPSPSGSPAASTAAAQQNGLVNSASVLPVGEPTTKVAAAVAV